MTERYQKAASRSKARTSMAATHFLHSFEYAVPLNRDGWAMIDMQMVLLERAVIVAAMRQLEESSKSSSDAGRAADSVAILAQMRGLIRRHNAQKRRTFYAPAQTHGDLEWVETAAEFHREEGELTRQFELFVARWRSAQEIVEQADTFRVEVADVLAAIADRGRREHALLYPLSERAAA